MKRKHTPLPNLRTWRRRQRHGDGTPWSQRDAAAYLHISQSFYSRLEREAKVVKGDMAKVIHRRTGVDLAVLVGVA